MSEVNRAFPHQHLLAYQYALKFHRFVSSLKTAVPPGFSSTYDQLLRAAVSGCLNVAEGASAWEPGNKRRYFRTALASMGECAGALEVMSPDLRVDGAKLEADLDDLVRARRLTSGLLKRFL